MSISTPLRQLAETPRRTCRALRSLVGASLLVLLFGPATASAQMITVSWNAHTDPKTDGYILSYGTAPGQYTTRVDVKNVTEWRLTNIDPAATYYFVVQAYTKAGVTSPYSDEVSYTAKAGRIPSVKSAGDLTGDGEADFVWQHESSGRVLGWAMAGTKVAAPFSLTPADVADAAWKIVGRADFNGDGHDDLLWQNRESEGLLTIWLMNGTNMVRQVSPDVDRVVDLKWRIAGTGDLNRDGRPDIVWQHETDGSVMGWLMDGTVVQNRATIGTMSGKNWTLAATGDLNRDGHLDLVWHHQESGAAAVWLLNDVTVVERVSLTDIPGASWTLAGLQDMNRDGKLDIVWQNRAAGTLSVSMMNGLTLVRSAELNPPQAEEGWRLTAR